MIYKTHHIAGVIGAEATLIAFQQPILSWQTPVAILTGYFAGIMADADQPQSIAGQRLLPLAILFRMFGVKHRTLTHSILFMFVLWFILTLAPVPDVIKWAFLVGYATHPFIDLFNEQGVALLYPLDMRINIPFINIGVDGWGESLFRGGLNVVQVFMMIALAEPYWSMIPISSVSEYGHLISTHVHAAVSTIYFWI